MRALQLASMRRLQPHMAGLITGQMNSGRYFMNNHLSALSGTPYCSEMDVIVAIVSISPETVLPSFAMRRKISPG